MKAIILASGSGKRLRPLTNEIPKPLVKVGELSILERIINSLIKNNLKDIVITTGPFEEKIKELIKNKYSELNVEYVKNPIFNKTNYIYSLWLTKDIVKNHDVILIHGDMFFDPELMKRIVESDKSFALIKSSEEVPEKDFKARVKNGLIEEIGVNVFGEGARFCAPIYKILKKDFEIWLNQIEVFVKEGNVNVYAENALNMITDRIKFYPAYYDEDFCMEIDDFEDLEKAKNYLKI